ncbi:two-partner secretion domain-containing protein [Nostoc sp. UHCC 0870]|uniref:two-partner secretion domain-containing protein n=1 Tax=Nostoc sp. UHCC 0870 TaxID=2914041 RepID=UPI001EDFA6FF|nr:filamentous hemagglutinin N-terminal domain-containing protein [Nostoc sp. UHCC 0870]UKP00475.1 filamentous hemagglutinin N-terminal domain-containing protein [Nostoc sp. UHCC 0870]
MRVSSVGLGLLNQLSLGVMLLIWCHTAHAQVTSDGTTNTLVNQSGNNFNILNGINQGNNLFHSFSNFSVPTNGSATFNLINTPNITTIFSRVTGGNVSNINGLIRTLNSNNPVSLFLMNPNGIIFGQNARLDIGGSFVGTTANSINFSDGTEFSTVNPTAKSLLTMSVPIGLQMGTNPGTITNGSRANNGVNLPLGLRVIDGRSISLIGGNVEINGGRINALGGKIELIALGSGGVADFSLGEKTTTTTVKENSPLANITLNNVGNNTAQVIVMSDGGGDIAIAGQNVSILNRSNVRAGIAENSGTTESVAGNIDIFAPGRLQVQSSSNIFGRLERNARGQGGNINIRAGLVSLTEGGRVEASLVNLAQGNAGNINILADAIEISGTVPAGSGVRKSGMSSSTQANSMGNGGLINLQADRISLTEGADIEVSTRGTGNAGSVDIKSKNLFVSGIGQLNGFGSTIVGTVWNNGTGEGGNIKIETDSLHLSEGGRIVSVTNGKGNAGNITIDARSSLIEGVGSSSTGNSPSQILTGVSQGTGNGGNLTFNTDSLTLLNGGQVNANTQGNGNAGFIEITANNILIDGIHPLSATANTNLTSRIGNDVGLRANGNGGIVKIVANSMQLSNGGEISSYSNTNLPNTGNAGTVNLNIRDRIILDRGGISTRTTNDGIGGKIDITAGQLSLNNQSFIQSYTSGSGNAGIITVKAEEVTIDGNSQVSTGSIGSGSGGSIDITAGELSLNNQSFIQSDTTGSGNAGIITVKAGEVAIDGNSQVSTASTGTGSAGDISFVETNNFSLKGGSQVTSSSTQTGDAGSITLDIANQLFADNGVFSTSNRDGIGGEIDIIAGQLSLNNQSLIQSDTTGSGNAGIITVKAGEVAIDGNSQVSTASTGTGSAGNISFVETNNFSLKGGSQVTSSSTQTGDAGSITLNIANQLFADNGVFSTSNRDGVGGSIDITTGELGLSNQSSIDSSTTGRGNAGQVTINAANSLNVDRSQISSQSTGSGNGGTLNITASQLAFTNDTSLSTTSFASGNAGNLNMRAEIVKLDNNSQISSRSLGSGIGGSIQVLANNLKLNNNAQINVQTASGNGGNIDLNILDLFLMRDLSILSAEAEGIGNGGNINITSPYVIGWENSDIIANAFEGNGGNITITTQGIFGLAFRNTLTPRTDLTNDITASSQFNLNGTVQINNIGADPNSGLIELPANVTDQSQQIASGCADTSGSSFVATGRGGIPQNPSQDVRSDTSGGLYSLRTWSDVRDISAYRQTGAVTAQISTPEQTLVQATGWRRNADGKIEVFADKSSTGVQQALTCAAVTKS